MGHNAMNPKGTDNVLVDLGFEDAEELAAKARLALKLNEPPWLPAAKHARKLSGMSSLPIQQMSWQEKLRAMEELWESLSKDAARLESPAWHGDALRETERRYEGGHETPVDWSIAKRELRERRT